LHIYKGMRGWAYKRGIRGSVRGHPSVSLLPLSSVRGHPSISLLPLSSPTFPLSICTPYPHLCIISKDRTYGRRPPGLMVQRLPRSRLTDSHRLPMSPPARTSTASDGLRMHWDPPPSRGQPYMGGLVLGGLVLHSFVYYCRLT
jgi:hypothetical protein